MNVSETFLGFVRRLIGAFFVLLVIAALGHAQSSGTVGIYTREITVFSNQSTTTHSAIFPDFGFGANNLYYCTTNFVGTIDLEWSPPIVGSVTLGPFFGLPQALASYPLAAPDSACHVIQVGAYFPNMRSSVTVTAGSLTAWFTANAGPVSYVPAALGSNGSTSPILCDQNPSVDGSTSGSTIALFGPIITGDTVVICGLNVSFQSAPSTGNVQLVWSASSSCSAPSGPTWEIFTSSTTPLIVSVPFSARSTLPRTYPYACFVNNSGVSILASFTAASVHGL